MDNSTSPVNLRWKETVLLLYEKNTQDQGILKVRDYNQFLTIMSRSDQRLELKYSNLQEHSWLKCQYHHNNLEIRSLEYPRQFILAETDHKILKPRHHSSQYAADDREHRKQVRFRQSDMKVRRNYSLSQRVWEPILAKALTKGDCEFVHISRHLTKILRHTECHESDGAVRWDHILTSKLRIGKKKSASMHSVVLLTNPEWSIVRIKNERL